MKPYTYLIIDLACVALPFLASFYPKFPFYKKWRSFVPACLIVSSVFLIWDLIFTNLGIWGFNPDYLVGVYLFSLPLEEILFFICIPYACIFTYYALLALKVTNPLVHLDRHITVVLLLILSLLAAYFYHYAYTFVTYSLTALFLIFCLLRKITMSSIYLTFIFILPFFFISNGLLTGSFLEAPVVWYNNDENLGIRLLTIPVEDLTYGFLLIALNIVLFNAFDLKIQKQAPPKRELCHLE